MLIYSKEPLNVMMKNILLLDDPFTSGYVYVNKETYDQALSLNITYNQDIGRVKQTISGKGMLNWAANKVISHVVSFCSEHFCSPLNMLAPYLAYTLPIGVEWPEDDAEIIKMAYGVLNQMSQFVNFYGTALMPATAKADITIPKNIIMSYEDSWKAQIETLDKCVVAVPVDVDMVINEVMEKIKASGILETLVPPVQVVTTGVIEPVPVVKVASPIPEPEPERSFIADLTQDEDDDISVKHTAPVVKEEESNVSTQASGEIKENEKEAVKAVEEKKEESDSGEEDEEDEDDLEARILAMMKQIEDAPAEEFTPKDEPTREAPKPAPKVEKKEDVVNFGESGTINMTEQQIAEGNRRLLNDYDL